MRLFTEGFESGDLLFFSSSAQCTASTTTPRSGAYCLLMSTSGTATKSLPASVSQAYFRIGLRATGTGIFFRWRKGTTELGSIRLNAATRNFEIYTSTGTLVATGTVPFPSGAWASVEVYVKIADSGGEITVRVDGTQNVTYAGDTKPGTDGDFDNVIYSTTGYIFDDLAINDTTGASDNSWCGDGKIIALTPNANGDLSQLTGSDGNSTDNYLLVDEVPSDGDTTYVEGSTVDQKDLYNLTASGLTGVTIKRVWAESRSWDTVAVGGLISLLIKTNGVEYAGADRVLATSYAPVFGDDLTVNPNTTGAWSVADLDALQVGPKTRS